MLRLEDRIVLRDVHTASSILYSDGRLCLLRESVGL